MSPFHHPFKPSQSEGESSNPDIKGPKSRVDKIILYGFVFVLMGLLTLEVFVDLTPARLTALLFLVLWVPLTFLHEAGHALMAKLLGWHVESIHMGFGKVQRNLKIAGVRIELRTWPIVGMVRIRPSTLKWAKVKNALIYAAGPGVELFCVGVVMLTLGLTTLLGPTDTYGMAFAHAFCLAAVTGAVINLLPISSDPNTVTDGMGILMSPFLTRDHFEAALIQPELERGRILMESGHADEALALFEELDQRYPRVLELLVNTSKCLVLLGHAEEALIRLQARLRGVDALKQQQIDILLNELRLFIKEYNRR